MSTAVVAHFITRVLLVDRGSATPGSPLPVVKLAAQGKIPGRRRLLARAPSSPFVAVPRLDWGCRVTSYGVLGVGSIATAIVNGLCDGIVTDPNTRSGAIGEQEPAVRHRPALRTTRPWPQPEWTQWSSANSEDAAPEYGEPDDVDGADTGHRAPSVGRVDQRRIHAEEQRRHQGEVDHRQHHVADEYPARAGRARGVRRW